MNNESMINPFARVALAIKGPQVDDWVAAQIDKVLSEVTR